MSLSELSSQYAKALFQSEKAQGMLLEAEERLKSFDLAIKKDRAVFDYFVHPQIPIQEKKRVLETLIAEPILVSFILFLIEKEKLSLISEIREQFSDLNAEWQHQINASLITAVPVSEEQLNQLKARLEETFQKKSNVVSIIDPTIIGGTILILGNRRIDHSIKGRLNQMKSALLRSVNVT